MARSKFVEVIVPSEGLKMLPAHSLAGYNVCSDYMGDEGRHLFFRREESSTQSAAKPKVARKKRTAKPAAATGGSQTSFETEKLGG